MNLDCFILVVLSWRLVNVWHSASLSTLTRIESDDWNDGIMLDNCPVNIMPYSDYKINMQSVIEQRDDKGIKPFCEWKACRFVISIPMFLCFCLPGYYGIIGKEIFLLIEISHPDFVGIWNDKCSWAVRTFLPAICWAGVSTDDEDWYSFEFNAHRIKKVLDKNI